MSRKWAAALMRLAGRNWITLLGASLTTVSALAIGTFFVLGLLGLSDSPYVALLALMVLPAVFVLGLLLIPLGTWLHKRGHGEEPDAETGPGGYPRIDFNKPEVRRTAALTAGLTIVNALIISVVSYEGVHYMDSSEFCGQVCHSVMQPEYEAYLDSPHARVECVDCHIGPGAPWFVRSKLSGMGQVFAVAFDTYEKPIPTPVENLRPSQDTCEQCHWPQQFSGDRLKVVRSFADDEVNTPKTTALLLHIGGNVAGEPKGIHGWHIHPERRTSYVSTDPKRQRIDFVEVREADGSVTEYFLEGSPATREELRAAPRRVMDCIDCHNRPTHIYRMPEPALDEAMAQGRIDATLPFIKKVGLQALVEAGEALAASETIARSVRKFYQESYGDLYNSRRSAIEAAVVELQAIYSRNVFPNMKVGWGTYPDNIGHEAFPGCFRCHGGEHSTADGRTINQDCAQCHTVLAWDEEDPEILKDLGIN